MEVIHSICEMQQRAQALRAEGRCIGFVPTMGYLHEGHLSLVRLARVHSDVVVVSIFVNPTQFGPHEDFERYPRDFARDEALCTRENVAVIFYPEVAEMYTSDASTWVIEEKLSQGLCGAARPGHFRGVCTVVAKLFNIVQPHVAVFGEKDGQQLRVIERMVRDLNFPIRIIRGPTVREPDGLAMSSRNAYLSPDERRQAAVIPRALEKARLLVRDAGVRDVATLKRAIQNAIEHAPDARIEYIEIVDDLTLEPVKSVERPCLVAVAVFVGKTRLIDNAILPPSSSA